MYDEYKKNDDFYTYIGADGETYYLDFRGDGFGKTKKDADGKKIPKEGSGYFVDNALRRGQKKHLAIAVAFFMQHGRPPTYEEYRDALKKAGITGSGKSEKGAYKNILLDIEVFKEKNKIPDNYQEIVEAKLQEDPQKYAFNDYYKDLYSLEPGTGGRAMYDELSDIYLRQAEATKAMADVQFQQQAMQQAQTIKAITDQVRAERMARLRAGMSEFQIANQDMQMMMANVNALNQNAQMMNQQRLEAQLNANLARDQAYLSYLEQSNVRGQAAAAMYAADSGNAHWNALQYMKENPGITYAEAHKRVTKPE
jgi:myosin heavy subunit